MKTTTCNCYTATIITVSQDILNGKIIDHNSKYISEELHSLGFKVKKLSVLPCNENLISFEVESLNKQFDLVIITGAGLNETEICYKAIAKVFRQGLETVMINGNQLVVPQAARTMSVSGMKNKVNPVIHIQGIYVLNGQLESIQCSFIHILKPHLLNYLKIPVYCKIFYLKCNNSNIPMNKNFANVNLEIIKEKSNTVLQLKASSTNLAAISHFEENFLPKVKSDLIESDWKIELNEFNHVENYDAYFKSSLEVIEKCLQEYGPENIFISFNGGKDCTVLLHLILAVLKQKFPDFKKPLFCVYVQSSEPFPEQNEFIKLCEIYYNLDIQTISKGIKDALAMVLKEKPFLKACLMGTRRTDPFSENLQPFQMTDIDWPQIMRVNPLLDWYYSDIWDYLLYFKIPYCALYDEGYTSIGNILNTVKNPHLLTFDVYNGKEKYLPAYKLLDASQEREGRVL